MENSVIEYNKGREVIYSVFSRIFLNIMDSNTYKMLEDIMPFLENYKEGSENKLLSQGAESIIKHIKAYQTSTNKEEFINDTAKQYTRLYCLGIGVEISESVYQSVEHLVGQEDEEIYNIYSSCNFQMESSSNEPLDHISYELMFLSYLSKGVAINYEKNKELAEQFLKIQKEFLENHLLQWVDKLIEKTLEFSESYLFYLPVTYFIVGFIKEDYEYLKEEIQ